MQSVPSLNHQFKKVMRLSAVSGFEVVYLLWLLLVAVAVLFVKGIGFFFNDSGLVRQNSPRDHERITNQHVPNDWMR